MVDKYGKYVIAILQSPMLGSHEDKTIDNAIIQCAYFNLSKGSNGMPKMSYKYSFIIEASSPRAYFNPKNNEKDMKSSAAQYHSPNTFVVLERAKSQVKLFLVDFSFATYLEETGYAKDLKLEIKTNGKYLAKQCNVYPAKKTLIWDSAHGIGGTSDFMGSSKMEGFAIDMRDHSKLWMINDNDFGLENNGVAEMHKFSLGRDHKGATVCEMPAHPPTPSINVTASKSISLLNSSIYRISDEPGAGAAENFDINEKAGLAYVANDDKGSIHIYDVTTSPVTPTGNFNKDGMINIRNYPNLYGMPQPDDISSYTAGDGHTYLVFANEGDAKDAEI